MTLMLLVKLLVGAFLLGVALIAAVLIYCAWHTRGFHEHLDGE